MKALVFSAKVLTIAALANACAPQPVPPRTGAASPSAKAKAPLRKPEWQQSFEVQRKECASSLDADDSGVYFVSRGLPDGALEWTHVGLRGEATTRLRLPLSDDTRIVATRALAGKLTILALGSKLELLTLAPNGDAERAELWPSYDVTTGSIGPSGAVAFTTGGGTARQLHVYRRPGDTTALPFASNAGRVVAAQNGLFLDESGDGAEPSPGISYANFAGLRSWHLAIGPIRDFAAAGSSGVWVTARYVQNLFVGSTLFHSEDAKSIALARVDAGNVRDFWMITGPQLQLVDEMPASDGAYYSFLGVPETLSMIGQRSRFSVGPGHYLFSLDLQGNGQLTPLAVEFGVRSRMAVSSQKIFILYADAQQPMAAQGRLRCTLAAFARSQLAR